MTQTNPYYYIAPSAITIRLNTLNNDPQYASVAVAPSTRIRIANQIPDRDNNIVNIDYGDDLDYKAWRLTSRTAHFADHTIGKDIHMYAVLPKNNDRGSLAYTTDLLDINGNDTTVPDSSAVGTSEIDDSYFIHLATFSYDPSTNTRILTYFDTGFLQTQKQENESGNGDWLKVFTWNQLKQWLQMIAPFHNILFRGESDQLIDITDIHTTKQPSLVANDNSLATTGFIAKFFATLEWVKQNYLSKTSNDSTPHHLTIGDITIQEGMPIGEGSGKSTGTLSVQGDANFDKDIEVGEDATINNNLTVYGSTHHKGDTYQEGSHNYFTNSLEMGSPTDPDKSFSQGIRGCKIYWNGSGWAIETDYLSVNKKMYAKEIEVDKVTHVGGEQILTAASCIADQVLPILRGENIVAWRVLFRRKDAEGRSITNDWQVGDLAYCQTFNIEEGTTTDFSNRYYWRAVIGTGKTDEYNFIVLSNASGQYDSIGSAEVETSPSIQSRLGSDAPQPEDHIIQFGFDKALARRNGNDIDDQTALERAGATLISGSGKYGRSLIMWEAITTFIVPKPRLLLSPSRVDMSVNSLSIRVGEGDTAHDKPIEDYINNDLDGRIIINGDDELEPTLEPDFIATLLSAVYGEEANLHTIRDLIGSVYITTNKMFYLLTEREDGTLTWLDDTDGTLRQLYDKYEDLNAEIDRILDDGCITYNEKLTLWTLYKQIYEQGETAKTTFVPPYSNDPTIIAAYDALSTAYYNVGYLFERQLGVYANEKPDNSIVYFSDYSPLSRAAINHIDITRKQMTEIIGTFQSAYSAYQTALSDYKVNSISDAAAEQAQQNAIDYVSQHLSQILDESTKATVLGWIQSYTDNNFVTSSDFELEKSSLSLYTQWIDDFDPLHLGGTGMWTHLQRMFVGTQSIQFDKDGNVTNFSKNGLATSTDITTLSSAIQNVRGDIISSAEIALWIEQSFSSTTNAQELKSHMLLKADDILIESGSPTLGNYFSLNNGNLWCQNITVEGVINNLINTVHGTSDKIIQDTYLGEGYHLDILNLGNVIELHDFQGDLRLPFYIDPLRQQRTFTRYQSANATVPSPASVPDSSAVGQEPHLLTPRELKQLVGREVTIFCGENTNGFLYYGYDLNPIDDNGLGDALTALTNGTPVCYHPEQTEVMRTPLASGYAVHLCFKAVMFKNPNGTFHFGFTWVASKAYTIDCSIDQDDNWKDEEDQP